MRRQLSSHEITRAIRPHEDMYVGRTGEGLWAVYAMKGVCFIKERMDACELVRWCSDAESDFLDVLELSGRIACIPMCGPSGVIGITHRLM